MYKFNLGQKFTEISFENPKKIALYLENKKKINFKKLNSLSNKFCNWLISKNVTSNDVVCISSDKSLDTFVLIIGSLKAGVAYTILDRKSPLFRLKKIITTVNPTYIFADLVLKKKIYELKKKYKIIDYKNLSKNYKNFAENLKKKNLQQISSNTIAYIMFTSGSTGSPKGVAINHNKVLRFIDWCNDEYNINYKDIVTNVNSLFFDNSIFDIFGGLFNGAAIIPVRRSNAINPKKLINCFKNPLPTVWFSVPSLLIYLEAFKAINIKNFPKLRKIIFGGEGFPKQNLKKLYDKISNKADLINVYGPTECTCICSSYKITEYDFSKKEMSRLAPFGDRLSKNFSFMILDKKNRPVRKGEVGELIICGSNVGCGYYNNDKETKEKFIQNPLNNKFKEIVYKSGDLVFKDKKNNLIYFASRKDNQVKYKGYRIELDEIENNINLIKGIKRAIVTFGKKNNLDEINCWLESSVDSKKIKSQASKMLPSYMIPNKFFILKKLPKNSNGKIDRNRIKLNYYDKK